MRTATDRSSKLFRNTNVREDLCRMCLTIKLGDILTRKSSKVSSERLHMSTFTDSWLCRRGHAGDYVCGEPTV